MPNSEARLLASGSYLGTGAAVEVNLQFRPKFVLVFNDTDGDVLWIGFEGLTEGHTIQSEAAISKLTSNGLSIRNYGFTAGTSLSESGKTMKFICLG